MPTKPDQKTLVASPGDVLRKEFIARYDITQDALAKALGVSRYSVNQLVNDRRNITAEMALRLSKVLGTTPEFWLNLQMSTDLARAREKEGKVLDQLQPMFAGHPGPPLASLDSLFGLQ